MTARTMSSSSATDINDFPILNPVEDGKCSIVYRCEEIANGTCEVSE